MRNVPNYCAPSGLMKIEVPNSFDGSRPIAVLLRPSRACRVMVQMDLYLKINGANCPISDHCWIRQRTLMDHSYGILGSGTLRDSGRKVHNAAGNAKKQSGRSKRVSVMIPMNMLGIRKRGIVNKQR